MHRDCGLCQECKRQGILKVGNECDHIKPKALGGTDDDLNLQILCSEHHLEKSLKDRGNK
jgi:5-methylcytosine-specific restriction enzyme A